MSDSPSRFDEDYLSFHASRLNDAASDREAATAWEVGDFHAGDALLDLACGHGRLSIRLAAMGAVVTGLDSSSLFLDIARDDAASVGVEPKFVLGDIRHLPWRSQFDGVICWFTSFGYFDDDENRMVLDGVRGALRPGGRFLLELVNRDSLLARFTPSSVTEVDGAFMIDQRTFDPLTARLTTRRLVLRDGAVQRHTFFIRLFAYSELRTWLLAAGFSTVQGFASDGSPLDRDSRRILVVATTGGG